MLVTRKLLIISLTLLVFSQYAFANSGQAQTLTKQVYKLGDNMQWKDQNLDEATWKPLQNGLPDKSGVFWLRAHITISESFTSNQGAFYLYSLAASEVYWNGEYLTSNGKVGDSRESEQPGQIYKLVSVPANLWVPGEHLISLRMSNFHAPSQLRTGNLFILLGELESLSQTYYGNGLLPLITLGGFLLVSMYFLQLYLAYSKDKSHLLFSLLCLSISCLLVAEMWKFVFGYTYDWHLLRLNIVASLSFLVACLLPLYFLHQFAMKLKAYWMLFLLILLALAFFATSGFDNLGLAWFSISFCMSTLLSYLAMRNKSNGAIPIFIGLSIATLSIFLSPILFHQQYLFLTFLLLIVTVLSTLVINMKVVQEQKDAALLTSARLQITLLKKNIQPHFILNTLMSIEQWIVEDPKTAIQFIDALANEFRQLNKIADQKLISLEQELILCKSHLKIMGYRKDILFELDERNLNLRQLIPPAIIHTLMENALTHNRYTERVNRLCLTQSFNSNKTETILSLRSPLSVNSNPQNGNGTGLQYIESRLQESFPDQWKFEMGHQQDNWVASITLPNVSEKTI